MAIYYDTTKKKWKVDIWHKGKRFRSKSFDIKALASKYERDGMAELDQLKLTGIQFKDYHYDELFQQWREGASYRKRVTSLEKDDQMHRDFVSPIIGTLRVSEIKPMHFEKLVSVMLKQSLSKSSVNKAIQHFKAVFNHSFFNETIARNPAKSFKQLKLDSKEMDYFFQEELDEFLTFANAKYTGDDRVVFVFYLILFLTGIRLGEALGLEWDSSFDFQRNTILINKIWSKGKIEDTTKGKKDRLIPMPSLVKSELLLLRNRSKGNCVLSRDGINPLDASNIRKRNWYPDQEEAGLRSIRIHDARHTYGAQFMMNGGNLYELSKVLGHSSIKTTERYAHLSNAHLAGVKDIIKLNLSTPAEVVRLEKASSLPIHSREERKGFETAVSD